MERNSSSVAGRSSVRVECKRRQMQCDGVSYCVVSAVGSVVLPYSRERVLTFIQDIGNLQRYEPKLWRVKHTEVASEVSTGFYHSTGLFLILPFCGLFSYRLRENGFHSEMETGMLAGHMNGGFKVTPLSDDLTRLKHYEVYELSGWKRPFAPIVEVYLRRAMGNEMRAIVGETQRQLMSDATVRPVAPLPA